MTLLPNSGATLNDHMLNHKRRFSFSCINAEELMLLDSQPRAPLHRRSASDSLAFLEKPYFNELALGCSFAAEVDFVEDFVEKSSHGNVTKVHENSLSLSDGNPSSGDEMPALLDSYGPENKSNFNSYMDPKKIKRMAANRMAAQRSRLRKLEYIDKLHRDIVTEEAKVSLISPQVNYYQIQRIILKNENDEMMEKLELLEIEKAYKEAEFQVLKEERDQLNLIYELLQEGK